MGAHDVFVQSAQLAGWVLLQTLVITKRYFAAKAMIFPGLSDILNRWG